MSLDAGRPSKQVSFSTKTGVTSALLSGASGAPKILVPEGSRRRDTSPGAILTGEFGFKPVADVEEVAEGGKTAPENEEAAPEGGDSAGSKRASMA